MEETCGTPWYSSPELLQGEPYTQAVDMWSLGVAMFVLLTGDFPFDHEDEDELMDLIIEGEVHLVGPKWDVISDQAKDLIKGLLTVDPKKRLTAVEATEHPWFTGEIEVQAAASVLHHAHMRLSRLVESAPGRLPVAVFEPGEWMARQGERGREVYMILEGEAEVVQQRGSELDLRPPARSNMSPQDDYVKVRTLRKGNFAGELAQNLVESRGHERQRSVRSSLERTATSGSDASRYSLDMHRLVLEATKEEIAVQGPIRPIAIPEHPEAEPGGHASLSPMSGMMSVASSSSDFSDLSSLAATSNPSLSPKDAVLSSNTWVNKAIMGLNVVRALVRVRRHWVGHRRTASVRALTQVKALVLNREDMHWAVEHDYRLTQELQDAMRKQRKKLRAKARERKQKMKRLEEEGGASV